MRHGCLPLLPRVLLQKFYRPERMLRLLGRRLHWQRRQVNGWDHKSVRLHGLLRWLRILRLASSHKKYISELIYAKAAKTSDMIRTGEYHDSMRSIFYTCFCQNRWAPNKWRPAPALPGYVSGRVPTGDIKTCVMKLNTCKFYFSITIMLFY